MTITRSEDEMYKDTDYNTLVQIFDSNDVPDQKIIDLIKTLAFSGKNMKFNHEIYDFASTGGPSSLSTILVPLYLNAYGCNVVNLAVPGRPAGAVDVLSQIPEYDINECGDIEKLVSPFYIHLAANSEFVPMDKALFEYRKQINKVNVPNLAIASLLAKKVAIGADYIGLDVRVSKHGNFGKSWSQCVSNSEKYNRIASALGIHSTCFLSDANTPYQRYIGRGEALEAIYEILHGTKDKQLQLHNEYCRGIAFCMAKNLGNTPTSFNVDFEECFSKNLMYQGSNYKNFLLAVEKVKNQPHSTVYSKSRGYVQFHLEKIRDLIVKKQKSISDTTLYPDMYGITLLCDTGDYVEPNTPILSVRSCNYDFNMEDDVCFSIVETQPIIDKRKEVISNG